MSLSCPVCRAVRDTGPLCRRCRADLTLCLAIEQQRDRAIAAGRQAAAQGDFSTAFAHIRRADELRRGPDSAGLRAALHLIRGDFAAAWHHARSLIGAAP
jgi:Flp pilus assembly protein TadD